MVAPSPPSFPNNTKKAGPAQPMNSGNRSMSTTPDPYRSTYSEPTAVQESVPLQMWREEQSSSERFRLGLPRSNQEEHLLQLPSEKRGFVHPTLSLEQTLESRGRSSSTSGTKATRADTGSKIKNVRLDSNVGKRKSEILTEINYHLSDIEEGHVVVKFLLKWSPTNFMTRHFGTCSSGKSVGSVIVLSGTSRFAQATTCEEYLQTYWPTTYSSLLTCLQHVLERKTFFTEGDGVQIACRLDGDDGLVVYAAGIGEKVVEIAQQLSWLGAALQYPPNAELNNCQANFQRASKGVMPIFEIGFQMKSLDRNGSSCWHSLFPSSVIAKGFPIAQRGQEVGLEISLEMMAALTGVRHAVEYKGGIILKSFSCAFLPVKRYQDSIQWHYIEGDENERLSYGIVVAEYPHRALVKDGVDVESLKHTRAFVGWWGITETHLGGENVNYNNIDYSAATPANRTKNISDVTIGFSQIITSSAKFSLGGREKVHFERKGRYQNIVRSAAKSPIVLYDFDAKRGWLVPSTGVLLHIARTMHHRDPYQNNGKNVNFPLADLSISHHQAAEKVMLEQADFQLGAPERPGDQAYCLSDTIRDIWSYLEGLRDENADQTSAPSVEIRGTLRDIVRGWEFMDIVDRTSPFRLKETYLEKSCGGWTNLARDIDALVLFGSGFEDIIRPKITAGLCHSWKFVPKDRDYLTASVPMMNHLFDRAGSKLSRRHLTSTHLRWHRGDQLWEHCDRPKQFSCNCSRLQQLIYEGLTDFGDVREPGTLEEEGSVIFGQDRDPVVAAAFRLQHPEPKEKRKLFSLPNSALPSIESALPYRNVIAKDKAQLDSSLAVSASLTPDNPTASPRPEASVQKAQITGLPQPSKQSNSDDDISSTAKHTLRIAAEHALDPAIPAAAVEVTTTSFFTAVVVTQGLLGEHGDFDAEVVELGVEVEVEVERGGGWLRFGALVVVEVILGLDVVLVVEDFEEDVLEDLDEVKLGLQPPVMEGTALMPLDIGTMFVPQLAACARRMLALSWSYTTIDH
ncbi:hypothetical protein LSUE1_G001846 [Lachnellula suecica]|uniref:Uncharacterized protein n=1 Tax=Lachnellula suecica TaxID=602035 RepID=A0A8T9CIA2_9HELO|nr:hypothetical protein LSUE1_G001846 [Lachnellula suecica]